MRTDPPRFLGHSLSNSDLSLCRRIRLASSRGGQAPNSGVVPPEHPPGAEQTNTPNSAAASVRPRASSGCAEARGSGATCLVHQPTSAPHDTEVRGSTVVSNSALTPMAARLSDPNTARTPPEDSSEEVDPCGELAASSSLASPLSQDGWRNHIAAIIGDPIRRCAGPVAIVRGAQSLRHGKQSDGKRSRPRH